MSELDYSAKLARKLGLQVSKAGYIRIPDQCKRLKIDVGLSFDAIHSICWLREDPELFVIGIEALSENVESIRELLAGQDMADVRSRFCLINCALSDRSGSMDFYVTKDVGQASLLAPKKFELKERRKVIVETLDDILSLLPQGRFSRIDFLKTDCQGHDFKVLQGAMETLKDVAIVTAEAESSSYVGSRGQDKKIKHLLEQYGFIHINSVSIMRVIFRKMLIPVLPKFILRIAHRTIEGMEKFAPEPGPVNTIDPTFVNKRFEIEYKSGAITALQFN